MPDKFRSTENSKQWNGWDLLWPIFKAHYGTKCILKIYHAGQTEHILSETGTQQGDPLGNALFSAPLHPIFIDIADKFDSLLINVFADNAVFIGRLSQILQATDMYYARIREIDLLLNPQESIIYIPNKDPTYSAPLAMNRNANTLHF